MQHTLFKPLGLNQLPVCINWIDTLNCENMEVVKGRDLFYLLNINNELIPSLESILSILFTTWMGSYI